MHLDDDIIKLKGIGEKIRSLFHKLNIYNIAQLLEHFPRTYIKMKDALSISQAKINEICAIKARLMRTENIRLKSGKIAVNAYVSDENGRVMIATWYNMPYMKSRLNIDDEMIFYGKIIYKNARIMMQQPTIYSISNYEKIKNELKVIYPLTMNLNNNTIINAVKSAFEKLDLKLEYKEYLSDDIIKKYDFMKKADAIYNIHRPLNKIILEEARNRLVFDEFFSFLMKLAILKKGNFDNSNIKIMKKTKKADNLIENLPFKLTNAQYKVFNDIKKDLASDTIMNRLIQGDVGSGKTIVAILSMIVAFENGFQVALMAPTEVLALQHYNYIIKLISTYNLGCDAVLLTGSISFKQKKEIYEQIKNHKVDFIIGTHAIIQEGVEFDNLALVITDEQHRFGVEQRLKLSSKSDGVHTLVMSATPIPRTLAIILYGQIDISIIDELPSNRLPIKNAILNKSHRKAVNAFLLEQVRKKRQCYIICPMIEKSDDVDLQNVIDYTKELKNIMPSDIRISALHGDMKASEKNDIMDNFKEGNIDILVSTTVIEVGIDVPNATVILIENADRFGLSQLHQLRGRIGRGKYQSYAMFMSNSNSDVAISRLQILKKYNSGFDIASEDLKLRGPGELFGNKQSGTLTFHLADIYRDSKILMWASKEVNDILKDDKKLNNMVEYFKAYEKMIGREDMESEKVCL